jgi:3-dehydroquinate dehydratase-1
VTVEQDREKSLAALREAIDQIDQRMVWNLNERMKLVKEIGLIKLAQGLASFDSSREEAVYTRLSKNNEGPLNDSSLRSIYREIMAASRILQHPRETTSPGLEGVGSSLAATAGLMRHRPQLCGCLMEALGDELARHLNDPHIDLIEWRLDAFIQRHGVDQARASLDLLSVSPHRPLLATNRPERHGGFFSGTEDARLEILRETVRKGAEWVDLEEDVAEEVCREFQQHGARLVCSHHDYSQTPDRDKLRRKAKQLAAMGADCIKVVTLATAPDDNLRVLELVPFGRDELGVDVIAFCMGPLGRWSRMVCLLLGSPWTYVQLPGQGQAAPGQLTASEIRALWEIMA